MSKISFSISENEVTKHKIHIQCTEGNLIKSLEEFREVVNETLTKMIEESGDPSNIKIDEIEDDDSSEDEDIEKIPKKKRK